MPVVPYLLGVVTAPLLAKILKPILRGAVKTTVAVALQVKKAAAEAGGELQEIAAEAGAAKVTKTQVVSGTDVL